MKLLDTTYLQRTYDSLYALYGGGGSTEFRESSGRPFQKHLEWPLV